MKNISSRISCSINFDMPIMTKKFDYFAGFDRNTSDRSKVFRFFSDLHNKIEVINEPKVHISYTNPEDFK